MADVSDLIRQLREEFEKQCGVKVDLWIMAHKTGNNLNTDSAEVAAKAVAQIYDGSEIHHKQHDGEHWINVDPPQEHGVHITIWHNKEGDPQ